MQSQGIPTIVVFFALGAKVVRWGVFLVTLKQIWFVKDSVAIFESASELIDGFNFSHHFDSPVGWFRLLADNGSQQRSRVLNLDKRLNNPNMFPALI
jgi:hypothetical protein